jgi:hypothetical protein
MISDFLRADYLHDFLDRTDNEYELWTLIPGGRPVSHERDMK